MSSRPSKSTSLSSSQMQTYLQILINSISQQLVQNRIVDSKQELQNIVSSPQQSHLERVSNIVNYLMASLIQEKQHGEQLAHQLKQMKSQKDNNVAQNDTKILHGLQIFVDMTQRMVEFSHDIYKPRSPTVGSLPLEICKQFRSVYQLAEELSGVFNQYIFHEQQHLRRRQELLAMQIKCMQDVYSNQTSQSYQSYSNNNITKPSQQNLPSQTQQTEEYILSLRQEISHLHETLLKNDDQFTQQIHNYNKTLRQMSNTIKAYEIELAELTAYQLKVQELETTIVRIREEKYRNQIVVQNMARKIRNYQKDIMGDRAFLSPQRQRLLGSPDNKFSMVNSKISNALSAVNSIHSSPYTNVVISPARRNNY